MGVNYALVSASILTVEKLAAAASGGSSSPWTYGIGGALGGGFLSGTHSGRRGVFAGGLVFGAVCGGSRIAWEWLSYEDIHRFVS